MATRVKVVMKTCPKCGLLLPESEYNRDRSKRDGLDTYCRVCRHEYMKAYNPQHSNRYTTPESRDKELLERMQRRHRTELGLDGNDDWWR